MVFVYIAKVQASISKIAASSATGADGSRLKIFPEPKEPFFLLRKWIPEGPKRIFYKRRFALRAL